MTTSPDPLVSASRRRRRWPWMVGGVLAIGLGVGGWQVYDIHVRHRLETVAPGNVFKSGAMLPADMAATATDLHLKTVIDLRTVIVGQDSTHTTTPEDIAAEASALAAVGVRHLHLPTGQVPDQATVDRFIELISDPANRPTLIHCYHGTGRAELFTALYRIELEGWDPEAARCATRFVVAGSSFDTDKEKGMYLKAYQPKHAKPVPQAQPTP